MTKTCVAIGLVLLCATGIFAEEGWEEYRTRHFLIYYKQVPIDFVKSVEESAERYYDEITDNLGFRRFDSWTFDDRARIYIYDDQEDYVTSARQASWSHGVANARNKVIRTFPSSHGFFDSTLPHELGHIIFREFIGFRVLIPLWLEEGVAMYQEKARRWGAHAKVQKLIEEDKFIPLSELSSMRLYSNMEQSVVTQFYTQSASVVYYLINEQGQARFVKFCRYLRDGYLFEEALGKAYRRFETIDDLNRAWVNYLKD